MPTRLSHKDKDVVNTEFDRTTNWKVFVKSVGLSSYPKQLMCQQAPSACWRLVLVTLSRFLFCDISYSPGLSQDSGWTSHLDFIRINIRQLSSTALQTEFYRTAIVCQQFADVIIQSIFLDIFWSICSVHWEKGFIGVSIQFLVMKKHGYVVSLSRSQKTTSYPSANSIGKHLHSHFAFYFNYCHMEAARLPDLCCLTFFS